VALKEKEVIDDLRTLLRKDSRVEKRTKKMVLAWIKRPVIFS